MRISSINNNLYSFKSAPSQKQKSTNPISKKGEKAKLATATFLCGLGLGVRLLAELADGDFLFNHIGKKADKIASKQKHSTPLKTAGIFIGLTLMGLGAFAAIFTLFLLPKINYKGNVNAFKKSKEMDVYIKGNETEKELYTQMNDKAKNANDEEKAKLKEQYLQMQMAKNKVPDFVKLNKKH